ncbi:MAG: class I SAM-dependent methyltransferase [Bacteroidales bacterium]|nr:class I SAM-dependent methyltransferase [Bacteroidales bacterium]
MPHKFQPDLVGKALLDYLSGAKNAKLDVFSDISEPDEIPVSHFFRSWDEMPEIEQKAIELCRGKVLDVGAAAGCHSLILQERGHETTAIDISAGAVEVMKKREIINARQQDFFTLGSEKFDTIMMLMNGIGICGKLENLDRFFEHAKSLLNPGGQILLDSSDILFMFEEEDGSVMIDLNSNYYGEVKYRFAYQGLESEPFDWLFLDFDLLNDYAEKNGFRCELIMEGNHFDYLARISPNA